MIANWYLSMPQQYVPGFALLCGMLLFSVSALIWVITEWIKETMNDRRRYRRRIVRRYR